MVGSGSTESVHVKNVWGNVVILGSTVSNGEFGDNLRRGGTQVNAAKMK